MKNTIKEAIALALCVSGLVAVLVLSGSAGSAAQQPAETFFNGYRTVEGMQAFLDRQVQSHPTLAEKVDFGDSWCKTHGPCAQPEPPYNGYDMVVLRITNRNIGGPKPVFWFGAGLHGHEPVPPEVALRFIGWLLDGYDSNADARWLVDYHDIWVVPMGNPDAHHILEAGGSQPYLQRKNADNDDGCTTFPPSPQSMFGTDLNRNFPFKWACCAGSTNEPCSQVYRGPSAGSAEETQAIMSKLRSLIPDQRGVGESDGAPLNAMGIVLDMHSIARINFFPWSYSDDIPPNWADLNNITGHISARESGGNGYRFCQSGAEGCLGRADGSAMDWAYGELGAASITIEIEGATFTPPYEQVETVWNNNRGALIYMAKIARAPYLLTRGPDVNEALVEPLDVDAGARPRISATINYAWPGNSYAQDVGAAEYYIDIPPWAGGTARPLSPADGGFDAPTERVSGAVETSGLAPGRHVIFVRGRGGDRYEGSESWGPVTAVFVDVVQSGGTPVPTSLPSPTAVMTTRTPMPPPVALPGEGSRLYPETGKTVSGVFLDYWNRNGGLAQQGFPISEVLGEVSETDGKAYTMQYFERAVFEYHPENSAPNNVLLSLLGNFEYKRKYPNGAPDQQPNTTAGSVVFPETGKRLGGRFLQYWQQNGGLAQQGYPISDELMERSDLNGQTYRVQYFERAVFEMHTENQPPYDVLLSQLGTFRYRDTYGGGTP